MLKKKFFCFDKKTVFVKNLEVKLSFVLYKGLRNIWMVPMDGDISSLAPLKQIDTFNFVNIYFSQNKLAGP